MPMLSELLVPDLPHDPEITGLALDSRKVRPGDLFAALPGDTVDGRDFIPQAIAAGAVAILAPEGTEIRDPRVVLITDPQPRRRLARMAARFFGTQPACSVAVTGTNGKTSTVNFVRQFWTRLGLSAASLGTLGLNAPGHCGKGSLTTPDVLTLHQILAQLSREGIDHLAFEASSHGLDQDRLSGVRLTAAGFTNLTRDHLDYHGSMESYFSAKARLFSDLLPAGQTAVINADDPHAACLMDLARRHGQPVLDYGRSARWLRLIRATPTAHGQDIELDCDGIRHSLHLPLAGDFQAANVLCALGLVVGSGTPLSDVLPLVSQLDGIPGRLQRVAQTLRGAGIYVDYAHTPDALETVLRALRPHATRRLVVVFGCGGNRDPGKRPLMGAIAARLADRVIVTDDNPRFENAATIRAAILPGCPGALEIADRRQAIFRAVLDLEEGDVLVVAGKGHESGQIINGVSHPFDDAEEIRLAVGETL